MVLRVAVYLLLQRLCANAPSGSIFIHYAAVRNRVIILRLTCTAKAKLLALVTKVCDSVSRNAVLVKYLVRY